MDIELLIPAGSIESFYEAINNGADAVYLGLKKFNARRTAENFSVYQLSGAVNQAHEKKKKIYLTLNIEIKSNELSEAARIIELAYRLKIDGIIVKDPALIYILKKYYKDKLEIHLSTQCGVSSSFGVEFAKKIGAFRVILAREMELSEIKSACAVKGIECEIFAQGSMCFSISGLCLGSSWVGGRSGNRGLCTAPCRVLWECNGEKFTYFSMKDLSLIHELDRLKNLNVRALKIEGRLKNPKWIKTITSIYRNALDNSQNAGALEDSFNELKKYSAREISTGHADKHRSLIGKNENWQNYEKIPDDKPVKISDNENNEIIIALSGNKYVITINFHREKSVLEINAQGEPRKAKPVSLRNIRQIENEEIFKKYNISVLLNDGETLTSSSFLQKLSGAITGKIKMLEQDNEKLPELNKEVEELIKSSDLKKKRKKILGDYPDKIIIGPNQLKKFLDKKLTVDTISVYLSDEIEIPLLEKLNEKFKIILSVPALLFEDNAKKIHEQIASLVTIGFKNFEANSYAGLQLLSGVECNKSLGIDMTVMNHVASGFFNEEGYSSVYSSYESDISMFKSLSAFSSGMIEALVFGKIKFFQSRVCEEFFKNRSIFSDKFGFEIECINENGLNLFVAKTPLAFLGKRIMAENIYFDSLTADLRYFEDPVKTLEQVFSGKFNETNSSTFNFFRKLV